METKVIKQPIPALPRSCDLESDHVDLQRLEFRRIEPADPSEVVYRAERSLEGEGGSARSNVVVTATAPVAEEDSLLELVSDLRACFEIVAEEEQSIEAEVSFGEEEDDSGSAITIDIDVTGAAETVYAALFGASIQIGTAVSHVWAPQGDEAWARITVTDGLVRLRAIQDGYSQRTAVASTAWLKSPIRRMRVRGLDPGGSGYRMSIGWRRV